MYILGVGDVTHDASVFLLKDAKCIAAIENERLCRIKHGFKPDSDKYTLLEQSKDFSTHVKKLTREARLHRHTRAIEYCLEAAHIQLDEIDHIFVSTLFDDHPFDATTPVSNIAHHKAHCGSSFFTSPFDNAAILAIDGCGEIHDNHSTSAVFAHGTENHIEILSKIEGVFDHTAEEKAQGCSSSHMVFSHSLGAFYQNITLLIGMKYFGEGKTMGLSAYGKYNLAYASIEDYIEYHDDGKISIHNREIFCLCQQWVTQAALLPADKRFQAFADLAYMHQHLLEKMVFHLCHKLYDLTGEKQLCLTGGVCFNSVLNGKIIANTPFEALHIIPPTGDNGIGLGAALIGAHEQLGLARNKTGFNPYLGKYYSPEEIRQASAKHHSNIVKKEVKTSPEKAAAKLIAQGKIVAWFSGSSEVGPRALGNRSILADARIPTIKDHLNKRVKHRERFRPFAPACLDEDAALYFDSKENKPFMLEVVQANDFGQKKIPAVVHVDGSARIQIVTQQNNETFYQLISAYKDLTGLGVVLNTSFNGPGEPIVETPGEAIDCFLKYNIDILFLNGQCFIKRPT